MSVIKRYPNRKLYNTETKQYITLEEIAELIRQGDPVQVLDYSSGEDLTALTLSQIVFEQEKKQAGFLPRSVLTGLIQAGGHTLGSLQHSLVSSLGLSHQVDVEIEHRIQALVNQGELDATEAKRLLQKLVFGEMRAGPTTKMQKLDTLLGSISTQEDLKQLAQQIDMLSAKLNNMP